MSEPRKNLPADLDALSDEAVLAELRSKASLSFPQVVRCQERIDRMTGDIYEEACRLLSQLFPRGARSTGRSF